MTIFATVLAYVFWDYSMRRGNIVLVAAFSYFTPLLSTIVSWRYLATTPGVTLWIACVLVIAGAVICKYSVVEADRAPQADQRAPSSDG